MSTRRRMALFGMAATLVVITGWLAVSLASRQDRLPDGLRVGTIPVGGLTVEQATRRIRTSAEPPPRLRLGLPPAPPIVVSSAGLAPTPDVGSALRDAAARGWRTRVWEVLGLGRTDQLPLRFRLDPGRRAALIRMLRRRVDRPPVDATVSIDAGRASVEPARPGRRLATTRLLDTLAGMPAALTVPTVAIAPRLTTAEARRTANRVRRITSGPVTVEVAGRTTRISPQQLAALIGIEARGATISATIDANALSSLVHGRLPGLAQSPRDAGFGVRNGVVRVIPARPGRELDGPALATAILRADGARPIRGRLRAAKPALTTARARRLGVREPIGTFRTPYECCPPRVTNIRRAAAILDGMVIMPRARFSLNEALGERTTNRGFVPAPQINAGRLEDAVGGGVSQIATTLFNAAFFAGLRLDRFTPHEFWIRRYPPGREATISWGGPELVFTNDWPAAVLVSVRADRRGVSVRLYSSRLGRRVTTTSSVPPDTRGAFTTTFTRRVWVGERLRRSETYRWAYRAPPSDG